MQKAHHDSSTWNSAKSKHTSQTNKLVKQDINLKPNKSDQNVQAQQHEADKRLIIASLYSTLAAPLLLRFNMCRTSVSVILSLTRRMIPLQTCSAVTSLLGFSAWTLKWSTLCSLVNIPYSSGCRVWIFKLEKILKEQTAHYIRHRSHMLHHFLLPFQNLQSYSLSCSI